MIEQRTEGPNGAEYIGASIDVSYNFLACRSKLWESSKLNLTVRQKSLN